VIEKVRRALASFGEEVATDAIGEALIRTCEWYAPEHESGASAATYFTAVARNLAIGFAKERTQTLSMDKPIHVGNHSTIEGKTIVATLHDIIPCNWLSIDSPEFNQVPDAIQRLHMVLQIIVRWLDNGLLDDADLGYGNRQVENGLNGRLAKELGVKPHTIRNAMVWLTKAARSAEPEMCRAVV
jgi:hypothetical protein